MKKKFKGTGILAVFAILLSAASIVIELTTGICTDVFFDPIPSPAATFFACLVPPALLTALFLLNGPYTKTRDRITLVSIGIALTVSLAFSLRLLPTIPFCIFGVVAMGLGLLGLCPYFAFVASLLLLKKWYTFGAGFETDDDDLTENIRRTRSRRKCGRMVWLGALPPIVFLFWGTIVLNVAQVMLSSDTVFLKYGGLSLLRYGLSRNAVETALSGNSSGFESGEWYTPQGSARERLKEAVGYLYGTSEGDGVSGRRVSSLFFWDRHVGGDRVGETVPGLDLETSVIDVTVSEKERTAYSEWTMTFHNSGSMQAEARTFIRLPPYGVVSKVSLWIGGEECPAAFGTTEKVKDAYRKVVSAKRDPLLVTAVSPGVVRLQCFPVPRDGTMKVCIGITGPLLPGGYARMPSIQYCNFSIPGKLRHSVSVKGGGDITLHGVERGPSRRSFTVDIDDGALRDPSLLLQSGGRRMPTVRTPDRTAEEKAVLVVDGIERASKLAAQADMVSKYFSKVYIARPYDYVVWDGEESLAGFLKKNARYKTVNALQALCPAVTDAEDRGVPMVWAYGETLPEKEDELIRIVRECKGSHIMGYGLDCNAAGFPFTAGVCRYVSDIPVTGEFDRDVAGALDGLEVVKRAAREDVARFPAGGRFESGLLLPVEDALPATPLYRLLIHSKVMSAWYNEEPISGELLEQTVAAGIVTPFTGAVVLENRQQYDEFELNPDAGEAVSVDEPGLMIMVALGLCALFIAGCKRKRALNS